MRHDTSFLVLSISLKSCPSQRQIYPLQYRPECLFHCEFVSSTPFLNGSLGSLLPRSVFPVGHVSRTPFRYEVHEVLSSLRSYRSRLLYSLIFYSSPVSTPGLIRWHSWNQRWTSLHPPVTHQKSVPSSTPVPLNVSDSVRLDSPPRTAFSLLTNTVSLVLPSLPPPLFTILLRPI